MSGYLVPRVDVNSTKDDEIKALRKMKKAAGEGSYLGMLLSADLMEWVERKIRSDFPPDLYQYYMQASDVENKLQNELDACRRGIIKAKDDHAAELKARDERGDYWHQIAESCRKEKDNLEGEKNDLLTLWSELDIKNKKLEFEILKLKAEIYDLKNGGNDGN